MAQPQILEGTTEEITALQRRGTFAGRKLRVIVDPQEELLPETRPEKIENASHPKRPSALGKYAFVAAARRRLQGRSKPRSSVRTNRDCFCIVLAQEISGQVVTSDHYEFDPLVPLGIVPIHFIR